MPIAQRSSPVAHDAKHVAKHIFRSRSSDLRCAPMSCSGAMQWVSPRPNSRLRRGGGKRWGQGRGESTPRAVGSACCGSVRRFRADIYFVWCRLILLDTHYSSALCWRMLSPGSSRRTSVWFELAFAFAGFVLIGNTESAQTCSHSLVACAKWISPYLL